MTALNLHHNPLGSDRVKCDALPADAFAAQETECLRMLSSLQ
jgi:hypothetical protein